MAALSDFLENKLIDHIFRGQTYASPTAMYIGLHTTTPSDAGGGTEVANTGSTYTRISYPPSLYAWQSTNGTTGSVSSGTNGTTLNANTITFPVPNTSWGSIAGFGIYDALSAGNLLFYGALTTPKTVNANDAAPSFAATALSIQLDN